MSVHLLETSPGTACWTMQRNFPGFMWNFIWPAGVWLHVTVAGNVGECSRLSQSVGFGAHCNIVTWLQLLRRMSQGRRLLILAIINKSTQSNVGRGLRRCENKSPLVAMASPKFAPKSTSSRGPIAKPHYLRHPWTRPTYDTMHPDPICHFSTMHWTDRRTYGQTDRSCTGKFGR